MALKLKTEFADRTCRAQLQMDRRNKARAGGHDANNPQPPLPVIAENLDDLDSIIKAELASIFK